MSTRNTPNSRVRRSIHTRLILRSPRSVRSAVVPEPRPGSHSSIDPLEVGVCVMLCGGVGWYQSVGCSRVRSAASRGTLR